MVMHLGQTQVLFDGHSIWYNHHHQEQLTMMMIINEEHLHRHCLSIFPTLCLCACVLLCAAVVNTLMLLLRLLLMFIASLTTPAITAHTLTDSASASQIVSQAR